MTTASEWLTPRALAGILGVPIETLDNWRATDVGPPYVKLSKSAMGRVRYRIEDVRAWQQGCERVIPTGWQPIGTFPGESAPGATPDRIEWLTPGRAAAALGIPIPTLTAWYKCSVGLPFIWIGGRGQHKYMYDRCDVEAFISRRKVDPSVVPGNRAKRIDTRTRAERKAQREALHAGVRKSLGWT